MTNTTKPPQFTIPEWLAPHVAEVRGWSAIDGEHAACWVDACERSPFKNGLCKAHYSQARERWLTVHPSRRRRGGIEKPAPERTSSLETTTKNAQKGATK